ncbi:MAG: DNA-binding protein Alba [Candidatus Bathyarchaeota archaeon]|nr:MAG: DNA-binding protein Alba [Candidatus Bathyarchaeota archaeon]
MTDMDTVYIGNKPPMSYVMALITAFNAPGVDSVVIKARGRAISRAVDVAEIAKNRYLEGVETDKIEIGSEQMPTHDGGTRGVSTIAITMKKTGVKEAKPEAATPSAKVEAKAVEVAPEELLDISEIKGVGKATGEKLRKAGFTTVKSVAAAEPADLSEKSGIPEKVAAKLIDSAKELQK